jgi:DNA-binding NarL/FixJ family response regulator
MNMRLPCVAGAQHHGVVPGCESAMGSEDVIRVAVVEDDRSTREGLVALMASTPGLAAVGSFASVEEALRSLDRKNPDVLLLDIHLPGMLGSEAVKVFRARYPSMQILMLTVYAEESKVFESICNGACGYLLKKTPPERLLEAIKEAHLGGAPMSPEIARKVVMLFQRTGPPQAIDHQLTPHEVRLLKLLADGYSYKAAGERFNISVNTVRTYIRAIYEKLHVHSKSEAVSKALRARLF